MSAALAADYREQLQSLVPELLPLFLELLHALTETPEAYAEPLSRVTSALTAMQHLINMARPDQVGPEGQAHVWLLMTAASAACHRSGTALDIMRSALHAT